MNDLTPDERALLQAYRETFTLDAGSKVAIWAELQNTLQGAPRRRSSIRRTVAIAVPLAAAAIVAALAARWDVFDTFGERSERDPSQSAAFSTERDTVADALQTTGATTKPAERSGRVEPDPPEPVPTDPPAADVEAPPASRPAPRSSRTHARTPAPLRSEKTSEPGTDLLEQEMALLQRARSALASGQHQDALSWASRHRDRFPQGALTQEREAIETLAACELDLPGAEGQALEFLSRHPRSAFRHRIEPCTNRGSN